jgi:hypothetical protein
METSEGLVLRIAQGERRDYYRLTRIDADFGTAFHLQKVVSGSESYDVSLLPAGRSTCECLGHLRHGHKTVCKHIAALGVLSNLGKI